MAIGYYGCGETDFPKPLPSSQAIFTFEVDTVWVGGEVVALDVQFTDQSINAQSYLWDFGNGDTSTEQNPLYRFENLGTYTITLTISPLNDLHYNKLSATTGFKFVKMIFSEGFDGIGAETPDTWLPNGWIAVDADGDEFNWFWGQRSGEQHMRSQSYDSSTGDALTPDNWLITPEIDLSGIEGVEVWFTFNVCPTASTPVYRQEHYGIFVSTNAGTTPSDFIQEPIFNERLTESIKNWEYQYREVDLTAFVGQKIRVAIRHYESSDNDRIVIDNVEIFGK